jgi:hypothetical protein
MTYILTKDDLNKKITKIETISDPHQLCTKRLICLLNILIEAKT